MFCAPDRETNAAADLQMSSEVDVKLAMLPRAAFFCVKANELISPGYAIRAAVVIYVFLLKLLVPFADCFSVKRDQDVTFRSFLIGFGSRHSNHSFIIRYVH
jgi:hypothetical protein